MINYPALAASARKRLLKMHYEAKVGHIGGNLSVLDILLVLFHGVMREDDRCVLSKGHAAGALYITLWSLGRLNDDDLSTFHGEPTKLSGHPAPNFLPEIPFATGSLGHGLSLAAGMALARCLKESSDDRSRRVFCVLSDGELNEGSIWEAVLFAGHHRLNNLSVVVDLNGLQGFGATQDIAQLEPLAAKWQAFHWEVLEVDAHDHLALEHHCQRSRDRPLAIIARSVKGRGVGFMESQMDWHYRAMSEAHYRDALAQLDAQGSFDASRQG